MTAEKTVRIGTRDFAVTYDDAYGENLGRVFEPGVTAILLALQPTASVALDIGANIGMTTLLLSQNASHVHSFEIVPTTFEILQRNVGANRMKNVTLHPFGLGEASGEVLLSFARTNRSGAFIGTDDSTAAKHHVTERGQIVALDSFEFGAKVGIIKIDVEGYEALVLRGGRQLLARDSPVVVLELNHWCLNAFRRTSVPDFLDELRGIFPLLYAVDEDDYDVKDMHDNEDTYAVLHEHIVRFRYKTLVGCFTQEQAAPLAAHIASLRQCLAAEAARDLAFAARDLAFAERDQALRERDRAQLERDEAVAACTEVLASTSWRLTKPLRTVRGARQATRRS